MSDHLAALERRGDELERVADATRQANEWMAKHSTDVLVAELRKARAEHRGFLAHIDRLEAELAKERVVLP